MAIDHRKPRGAIHPWYLLQGLFLVVLSACSLGDDVDGYVSPYGTTSIADPDYDVSSAGVYRGVLVGSQGIFQIYIANEPGEYEAHLQFDDSSCTFYTDYFTVNPDWIPGDQIVNALFQGTFPDDGTTRANETASIDFSVGPTGNITNDMVIVTISGHADPITVFVYKERSDLLVLQYVGRAYNESGDPWSDWGLLVVCPEGSENITVLGRMIDLSDANDWWDIQTSAAGDGVSGVIFNESGGVTPIQGQTPTVDMTALYDGSNSGTPNVKIHGEFDTTKWPDRLSGWWKSYIETWGSSYVVIEEGEWDTERTPAPELGGIRINITGQPQSFFTGRICHYAICQPGGDPKNPADRIAEGTISLNSGQWISDVENLVDDQYDLYVAVDVDSDGYTFSGGYPSDGDLHDAETNVTVNGIIIDKVFTLRAVAGTVDWPSSSSGDLYVAIIKRSDGSFYLDRDVTYSGITNATSATYCIDATDSSLSGSYYLLGELGNLMGWYDDANGFTGSPPTPPINLDDLQVSYNFDLTTP